MLCFHFLIVFVAGVYSAPGLPAWFFGSAPGGNSANQLYYVNYPFSNKEPWYYPTKSLQTGFIGSSAASDAYMDDGKLSSSNSAITTLDANGNKMTVAKSGTMARGLSGQMVNYVGARAFRK